MGGRAKCLLEVQGQSLLDRLVRSVRTLGLRNPVLVLGHHAAEIQAHLAQWPEHFKPRQVVNPAPEDDPASSLHLGLRTLDGDVHAVMVLLADQPLLEAQDISTVLAAWRARPAGIDLVVPRHDGTPGHPLIFGRDVRQAVARGQGAAGVREWRRQHPQQVLALLVAHPRFTQDIDTEDDLATLATEHGVYLHWPAATPSQ